jgi:DNA-binding GntR family transcriptional regulator
MANQSKRTLLRHSAYEAIKGKILCLELRPGDRLSEAEIAESLGIGRTPVREALLSLEKEGLIEIKAGSGFNVSRFSLQEMDDYRLVRMAIEHLSLDLAIQRIMDAELKALRENLQNLERHIDDRNIRNIVKYESEFHDIIYKATRSGVICETIAGLNTKYLWMRAVTLSMKGAAAECLTQHESILVMIEKKDVAGAQSMMDLHLTRGWERLFNVPWLFSNKME